MKINDLKDDALASAIITVVFGALAYLSYQNEFGSLIALPIAIAAIGVFMTIKAMYDISIENTKSEILKNNAKNIPHDRIFGDNDLMFLTNSPARQITICAISANGIDKRVIEDFENTQTVRTYNHIVALDDINNKVIRANNADGILIVGETNITEELAEKGVIVNNPNPTLMHFNDYAFIIDDDNESITIVCHKQIYVFRFSDIVSISYDENGSNVFNKSMGKAALGGILFGETGAIVGSTGTQTIQDKIVHAMSIKILVKDINNPSIVLDIYKESLTDNALSTKKKEDKIKYETLFGEAMKIKDIFSVILDINDDNLKQNNTKPIKAEPIKTEPNEAEQDKSTPLSQSISDNSIADELIKLAKLKEAGVLSEEEFNALKKKLLNL